MLTLACLCEGERLRDLAAGFGISPATAWRRARETIALLAADDPRHQSRPDMADPRLLTEQGLFALGDKGYDGLDHDLVATPFNGRNEPAWQKEYNRLHARLRSPGERVFAQLKIWPILDQVRCSPHQVTQLAKAVQVLNDYEHQSR